MQASALHDAMQSGSLTGTLFAPTNEAVAALLDAESISMAAITRNSSLATQAWLCFNSNYLASMPGVSLPLTSAPSLRLAAVI